MNSSRNRIGEKITASGSRKIMANEKGNGRIREYRTKKEYAIKEYWGNMDPGSNLNKRNQAFHLNYVHCSLFSIQFFLCILIGYLPLVRVDSTSIVLLRQNIQTDRLLNVNNRKKNQIFKAQRQSP